MKQDVPLGSMLQMEQRMWVLEKLLIAQYQRNVIPKEKNYGLQLLGRQDSRMKTKRGGGGWETGGGIVYSN
jgi:hypothetical protein